MSLDHAILGFLSERPRSGYDLKTRCFDCAIQPLWAADQAQIYRTLDRLQRAKLISATRRRQSGRPERKIYDLTPAGRESLASWLSSPGALPVWKDPLLVQLYFASSQPDDAIGDVLTQRRAAHQGRLEQLRRESAALARERNLSDRTLTLRLTAFDGAIARERASVDWLDDCIEAVKQGALPGREDGEIGQRHLFGS